MIADARARPQIVGELRQFGRGHLHNGEARSADMMFRAADHIERMEVAHQEERRSDRRRIDRLTGLGPKDESAVPTGCAQKEPS